MKKIGILIRFYKKHQNALSKELYGDDTKWNDLNCCDQLFVSINTY